MRIIGAIPIEEMTIHVTLPTIQRNPKRRALSLYHDGIAPPKIAELLEVTHEQVMQWIVAGTKQSSKRVYNPMLYWESEQDNGNTDMSNEEFFGVSIP